MDDDGEEDKDENDDGEKGGDDVNEGDIDGNESGDEHEDEDDEATDEMTVTGRVFRGMVVGDEGSSWGEMGETKMDQKQEHDVINSQPISTVALAL